MRAENYEPRQHPPSHEFEINFGPNHPGIEEVKQTAVR